jgi:hypothetical protein
MEQDGRDKLMIILTMIGFAMMSFWVLAAVTGHGPG